MNIPEPKLVGFFPKLPYPKPDWIKNDTLKEICSVSNCISEGSENWINQWKHNGIGFYNSEEIMLQVLARYPEKYNFFAYKLYPLIFIDGVAKEYKKVLNLKTILSDYNFLGFDILSRSKADFFECSPLSCNNACEVYSVNQYCLIDKIEDAYNYCIEIEKGKWEPGPYHLFEVYRKKCRPSNQ